MKRSGYQQWPYGDDNMDAVVWEDGERAVSDSSGSPGDGGDVDADSGDRSDSESA